MSGEATIIKTEQKTCAELVEANKKNSLKRLTYAIYTTYTLKTAPIKESESNTPKCTTDKAYTTHTLQPAPIKE